MPEHHYFFIIRQNRVRIVATVGLEEVQMTAFSVTGAAPGFFLSTIVSQVQPFPELPPGRDRSCKALLCWSRFPVPRSNQDADSLRENIVSFDIKNSGFAPIFSSMAVFLAPDGATEKVGQFYRSPQVIDKK